VFRSLPADTFSQFDNLTKPLIGKLPTADIALPISGNVEANAAGENIRQLLVGTAKDGVPADFIFRLLMIAEAATILGRLHPDQLLALRELRELVRNHKYITPLSETSDWTQALAQLVPYLSGRSFRNSGAGSSRQELLSEALRALSRKGFSYRIDGHGAALTEPSYNKVCALIEKKIKRVGGFVTANAMLNFMEKSGRIKDGTLLHARTPSQLGGGSQSGTPWHFIYSLALKHLDVTPKARNPQPILQEMERLAVSLAASLDVEPHSSYENLSVSPQSVTGFLYETVIYDELFAIPQWQPLASTKLVELWLDALEAQGCNFPIGTIQDWKLTWKKVNRLAVRGAIANRSISELAHNSGFDTDPKQLLRAISSPSVGVNRKYKTPHDTQYRTAGNYPVLSMKNNRFAIQPKAVVGRAFCESLYSAMRKAKVKDLENKMGQALEYLTGKVFKSAGMEPGIVGGEYNNVVMRKDLEVDLIIETEDRIFLVECTKKPLTNRARGGHTLDGLRDLGASFVKLTQQLAQHEAHLRKVGSITFENQRSLHLNGRSVEKIGISLFDHGSLQNRDMTQNFVKALVNAQMHSDKSDAQKTLKTFNRRLLAINAAISEIISHQPDGEATGLSRFAMSTWWLSIDQLQYLALQPEGIWGSMARIRHMTAKSGDIVYELHRSSKLNDLSATLFDNARKMDNLVLL
jgi:hypothetical protein